MAQPKMLAQLGWPYLIADAMQMLRAVAPELRDVPIYLMPAESLGSVKPAAPAFVHPDADLYLRPHVAWAGRGMAVIFDNRFISAVTSDPIGIEKLFRSMILHEIGHTLREDFLGIQAMAPEATEPTPEVNELLRGMLGLTEPKTAADPVAYSQSVQDTFHDASWFRTCCHLHWRYGQLAIPTVGCGSIGLMTMGSLPFDGADAQRLYDTLAVEFAACAQMPFVDIINQPEPETYSSLWRSLTHTEQPNERAA